MMTCVGARYAVSSSYGDLKHHYRHGLPLSFIEISRNVTRRLGKLLVNFGNLFLTTQDDVVLFEDMGISMTCSHHDNFKVHAGTLSSGQPQWYILFNYRRVGRSRTFYTPHMQL